MAKSVNRPIYLVVTPFFPSPEHWQGAFVLDQVKAIERLGVYRIVVFKPCGLRCRQTPYIYDGIEVDYVPSFFMPSYFFNGFGGERNGKNLIRELKRKGISIDDISVVHVHTASFACYATALKKLSPKVKSVMQYHDPDPYQIRLGKWASWKPNALYRAKRLISQFKYIDLHLCISKKVEYNLKHFPQSHPLECYASYKQALSVVNSLLTPQHLNTYILYNGVDLAQFRDTQYDKRPSDTFLIGCIANFADWKDQITLIKAVESLVMQGKYRHLRVSFIGSGTTKQFCQDYIHGHSLDEYFIFEKEVHHNRLPDYYRSLDLFVLPSYFEGFGCVFTEAAACGVPFMGCKNQGYSEYIPVEEQDRWLIEPHDHERLAEIIGRYIEERSVQHYCHTFDIDVLVKDYLDYLETL